MSKTIVILSITALIALLSAPPVLAKQTADTAPPNVVLIFVDDLGYGDISLHGCTNYQTPHIDSIAKEGIRFSSGYVSGPACGPSRAALMTGRYMGRFGYDDNRCIREGVPAQEIFMPEMLREAGYITGHIGKWHLGQREGQLPQDRGFDESHTFEGKDLRPRPDWYAKKASEFIREHKDKDQPFFLYLATLEVHTKLAASDERLERVAPHVKDKWQRLLGGMVLGMDDMVGEVLKTLRDEGLDENTVVFFVSDNGASMANPVWIYDGTTAARIHPGMSMPVAHKAGGHVRQTAPLSAGQLLTTDELERKSMEWIVVAVHTCGRGHPSLGLSPTASRHPNQPPPLCFGRLAEDVVPVTTTN